MCIRCLMQNAAILPVSVPELIEALGGASALARLGDWPVPTVNAWKVRGTIPDANWAKLIDVAQAKGLAIDAAFLLSLNDAGRDKTAADDPS